MKKTILLLSLISTLLSTAWATDSEVRSLERFDAVNVATGIDAILIKGSEESISIEADGVELDKVFTVIKNGKLKVYIKKKWWKNFGQNRSKVKAVITYREELTSISSSSGATVEADHTIISDDLKVSASSGADLILSIDVEHLSADASSGADLELEGEAHTAEVDASSGASVKSAKLSCSEADLDVSSGAGIKISVSDRLTADASSGGSIKYQGNPKFTDIDKSSGGSVRQRNW